jgi:hypothetical protein
MLFGDERVIGPSNWLNVGRTFNVARVNLHRSDYKVSMFVASVVPGDNTDLHNARPGNNLYGVYASLENIVPQATIEPYVLWRLRPRALFFRKRSPAGTWMKSLLACTRRVHCPLTSTTTLNLTGRRVRSTHRP